MSRNDIISVEVIYQTRTAHAICVRESEEFGEEDIWLPLSQISAPRHADRGDAIEIEAPEWLLLNKGLI